MPSDTDFAIVASLQTALDVSDDQLADLASNAAADFARKAGFVPTATADLSGGFVTISLRSGFDADDTFTAAFADRVAADFARKIGFQPAGVFFSHDNVLPTITALTPATGAALGGTSVVITGTDLGTATSVLFADVPAASFVVDSATQISAVSPVGDAGAIYVQVITAYAQTDIADAAIFTYT